ncbi:MAG: hypothetical protein FWC71_02020 [Defluviitaleaceae bacterium]|nr:hypothetical protein [Defluviitaleaceae bacterium]
MFCSNCGQNLAGVATQYCPNCGHAEEILKTMNPQPPVGAPLQGPYGNAYPPQHQQQQYQQAQHPPQQHPPLSYPPPQGYPHHAPPGFPPYGYYAKPPAQGMAGTALGLGIVALIFPVPFLGVILGFIGILLITSARKQGNSSGLATAGLVMTLVGTVLAILYTIVWVSFLLPALLH